MKKSSSLVQANSVKNLLSVPSAFVTKDSAVVLATKEGSFPTFTGVAEAMLAKGPNALERASAAARKISGVKKLGGSLLKKRLNFGTNF